MKPPYRVIWEFMNTIDPSEAIVTHDSGSPRDQIMPFYVSGGPGTYIGWGKSHGLGTGLGLNMGAKIAAPEKFVVNFMGDAAFGMTGLDFETAVRSDIPIFGEGASEKLRLLSFLFDPPRRPRIFSIAAIDAPRAVPLGRRLRRRLPLEFARHAQSMGHGTNPISKSRGTRASRP